jgi:hypothetical protein
MFNEGFIIRAAPQKTTILQDGCLKFCVVYINSCLLTKDLSNTLWKDSSYGCGLIMLIATLTTVIRHLILLVVPLLF